MSFEHMSIRFAYLESQKIANRNLSVEEIISLSRSEKLFLIPWRMNAEQDLVFLNRLLMQNEGIIPFTQFFEMVMERFKNLLFFIGSESYVEFSNFQGFKKYKNYLPIVFKGNVVHCAYDPKAEIFFKNIKNKVKNKEEYYLAMGGMGTFQGDSVFGAYCEYLIELQGKGSKQGLRFLKRFTLPNNEEVLVQVIPKEYWNDSSCAFSRPAWGTAYFFMSGAVPSGYRELVLLHELIESKNKNHLAALEIEIRTAFLRGEKFFKKFCKWRKNNSSPKDQTFIDELVLKLSK